MISFTKAKPITKTLTEGPNAFVASQPSSFLSHLVQKMCITNSDLTHIEQVSLETDEAFDLILCKLGLITERELARRFSAYCKFPLLVDYEKVNTMGQFQNFSALNSIWLELCRIIPIYENDSSVVAAVVNPLDQQVRTGLSFALGKSVSLVLVTQSEWETLFAKAQTDLRGQEEQALDGGHNITADVERLKDMASAEPVVRLVNRLLAEASDLRASDIHIEPGIRDTKVRFRIDGELNDHETISPAQGLTATSRIKILAQLDIAERRRPQDGRFSFPVAGHTIDLRISTVPTDHGESLVIRLLDQSRVQLDYEALGFFDDSINVVDHCLKQPHGILLVTGPTGSGKTTTLYTFLKQLANGERKILTIEDPIEYRLDGVNQSQVNSSIGVTFANALRSFLRHDPDVMMVGEIRDLETAQIAVQAALTGHLVLSTLHTNDAPSAITRLRDIGVEDYLIASTLIGVIGQRLVRRSCETCCGPLSPNLSNSNMPTECSVCQQSGYKGRLALVETLSIDDQLRTIIRDGGDPQSYLYDTSQKEFISMRDDGKRKILAGLTTKSEVRKAVGSIGGDIPNDVSNEVRNAMYSEVHHD